MMNLAVYLVSAIVSVLLLWTQSGVLHTLIIIGCWLANLSTWTTIYHDREEVIERLIVPQAPYANWLLVTAFLYIVTLFNTGHWVLALSSLALNVWVLYVIVGLPAERRVE